MGRHVVVDALNDVALASSSRQQVAIIGYRRFGYGYGRPFGYGYGRRF